VCAHLAENKGSWRWCGGSGLSLRRSHRDLKN